MAAELFLAHGYDGVSLDEIVRAAGGSKTNVYAFYGGKEGLFLAAVEARCRHLQERLGARDLAGLGLEEGLRALGRDLVALLMEPEHLALYRLVIGGTARFPASARSGTRTARWPRGASSRRSSPAMPGSWRRARGWRMSRGCSTMCAVMDLLHRALIGEGVPDEAERERAVEMAVRAGAGG